MVAPINTIGCHLSLSLFLFIGLLLHTASCFSAKTKTPSPPPIITCKSTSEVQRAIDRYVNTNDVVLELGAQLSDTSAHLCRAVGPSTNGGGGGGGGGGKAVLVDVKRKEATSGRSFGRDTSQFIRSSSTQHNMMDEGADDTTNITEESFVDRVEYHILEQFDEWRNMMNNGQQYNVMILDVGSTIGNDLYLSALSIATEFIANQQQQQQEQQNTRKLRAIIIKSKVLSNISRRVIHSQRLLDGTIAMPTKDELDRNPYPLIIPCVGVNDYRKTIPFVIEQGDSVIEVGCHYGTTTELLQDAAVVADGSDGFCAGVDIGEKIIKNAKRRYPEMVFEVVDAWNTLDLLKVKLNHCKTDSSLGYDVVYADIGGLSGAHGLLESMALLDAIGRALEPRCIVIKSLCVKRLASQLVPMSRVKAR